jgi:pimeloyl-ACP methyl ester carboxylesterase
VVLEPASTKGIKRTKTAYLNGIIKKGLDQYHRPHTDNVVLSWTDYWLQEGVKDWNMLSHLEKIETPVFFIQGDKDMFGTFRQADEIKKRVKGPYRELLLTDCGHMPHFEKQEKVLAETAAFFSDV